MFGWMMVGYCCFVEGSIFWGKDVGYVGGGVLHQDVVYEVVTFCVIFCR